MNLIELRDKIDNHVIELKYVVDMLSDIEKLSKLDVKFTFPDDMKQQLKSINECIDKYNIQKTQIVMNTQLAPD